MMITFRLPNAAHGTLDTERSFARDYGDPLVPDKAFGLQRKANPGGFSENV